ncbi:hypothetical protein [Comamonas testosteroni]|nr:hypothetical protein U0024_08975 [Comamonas testosteroni]
MKQPETCEISQTADSHKVDDLAMLVRRLVHALRKAAPGNDLADQAMGYLTSYGLAGTFLHGSSAFVPEDVPAGLNPGKASEPDGTSASACHPKNVPAPAVVAALLEALESIVDVCEGHDFDGAPSDAHMEKARIAISAYRAALAATPAAAAPVTQTEATWCEYIAGMIGCYLKEPDESPRVKAIAGIIERRLWALPAPKPAAAPVVLAEPVAWRDALSALVEQVDAGTTADYRALLAGVSAPAAPPASQRDELLQVALDFIGTLTGMSPPPIEVAPPEVFAPFYAFVDRVQAITAPQAQADARDAAPAASEQDALTFEQRMSDWQHGDALDAERWRELCRLLDIAAAADDMEPAFPGSVHDAFQLGGAETAKAIDASIAAQQGGA